MALARDFEETVKARVVRDAAFPRELLREAIERLPARNIQTGKTVLRDYVNATVGFLALAEDLIALRKA